VSRIGKVTAKAAQNTREEGPAKSRVELSIVGEMQRPLRRMSAAGQQAFLRS